MKINKISAFVLAAATIAACDMGGIGEVAVDNNTIKMTVTASPEAPGGTRVTFEGQDLVWEGDETLAVLMGNSSSRNGQPDTYKTVALQTLPGEKGVFTGTVDLGKFKTSEIVGVVCPYYEGTWSRYNSGQRILMQVGVEEQVQLHDNVLNGRYAPLFAEVTYDDFTVVDGVYTIEGKTLMWGCSLIRFNVYGSFPGMAPDEIIKSIELTATANINGNAEWKIADDAMVYNSSSPSSKVRLEEACTVADKNVDNGVKLYMSILVAEGSRNLTFSSVVVTTDKATYAKTISRTESLSRGSVQPINLDLSTFDSRVSLSQENYSIDGGKTWSSKVPTASDSFTSLAVKDILLSIDDLNAIKSAINAQASPVDLDLSKASYASKAWPVSVFKSTSDAPNTKLRSIKFPGNVTDIEGGSSAAGAFAYCSALESIDLTGIKFIGSNAFTYTGLTKLEVPNTVDSVQSQAFRWNFHLTETYYDVKAADNNYILCIGDSFATGDPAGVSHTVVIGPDVELVPQNFLRSSPILRKVVFKGSPIVKTGLVQRCMNLETIEFESTTPPKYYDSNALMFTVNDTYGTSLSVPVEKRKLIVPKGCKEVYEASDWKDFVSRINFTIEEKD